MGKWKEGGGGKYLVDVGSQTKMGRLIGSNRKATVIQMTLGMHMHTLYGTSYIQSVAGECIDPLATC